MGLMVIAEGLTVVVGAEGLVVVVEHVRILVGTERVRLCNCNVVTIGEWSSTKLVYDTR